MKYIKDGEEYVVVVNIDSKYQTTDSYFSKNYDLIDSVGQINVSGIGLLEYPTNLSSSSIGIFKKN